MTNKLPDKLSALRKYFSFAQLDIASKLGVPVSEYMKWENGNTVCGIEDLRKIANVYGVSVQELFINSKKVEVPEIEKPFESIEIPQFVEATPLEQTVETEQEASEETIEQTKQVGFDNEEDGRTKVMDLNDIQSTTVMHIQDEEEERPQKPKKQSSPKEEKGPNKKLIGGIIAGVAVVVIAIVAFFLFKGKSSNTLSLTVGDEKRVALADTYSAYVTNRGALTVNGSAPDTSDFTKIVQVDTDGTNLIGLKKDGTLVYTGNLPSEVQKWKNITSIAISETHYVAVEEDGTVVCYGDDDACKVDAWTNMEKVYAGDSFTIGIDTSGRIKVSGDVNDVDTLESLIDVKAVAIGEEEIAVLFNSGKVTCSSLYGSTVTNTASWSNIQAVAIGSDFVAGITSSDTVIVATTNDTLTEAVAKFASIKYIAARNNTLVVVNLGEQVLGAGDNSYNQYGTLEDATPTPNASSTPEATLASVTNIKCTTAVTGVSITWDAVTDASYYEVSVNTTPNATKIKSASTSANIATDKFTDGATYTVSIVAYPKDTEKYSESVATTITYAYSSPIKQLGTPSGINYSQNDTTITFTWNAVPNATGYTAAIEMNEKTTDTNSVSFDASSLSNGEHTVYISATSTDSAYTESEAGSLKFTYTRPTTPLTTPTVQTATVNKENGALSISWQGDVNASGYDISVGDKLYTSDSSTLVVGAENLDPGTTYTIIVTAKPKDSSTYSSSSYTYTYEYDYTPEGLEGEGKVNIPGQG